MFAFSNSRLTISLQISNNIRTKHNTNKSNQTFNALVFVSYLSIQAIVLQVLIPTSANNSNTRRNEEDLYNTPQNVANPANKQENGGQGV